jgi:hypothetical protein
MKALAVMRTLQTVLGILRTSSSWCKHSPSRGMTEQVSTALCYSANALKPTITSLSRGYYELPTKALSPTSVAQLGATTALWTLSTASRCVQTTGLCPGGQRASCRSLPLGLVPSTGQTSLGRAGTSSPIPSGGRARRSGVVFLKALHTTDDI